MPAWENFDIVTFPLFRRSHGPSLLQLHFPFSFASHFAAPLPLSFFCHIERSEEEGRRKKRRRRPTDSSKRRARGGTFKEEEWKTRRLFLAATTRNGIGIDDDDGSLLLFPRGRDPIKMASPPPHSPPFGGNRCSQRPSSLPPPFLRPKCLGTTETASVFLPSRPGDAHLFSFPLLLRRRKEKQSPFKGPEREHGWWSEEGGKRRGSRLSAKLLLFFYGGWTQPPTEAEGALAISLSPS